MADRRNPARGRGGRSPEQGEGIGGRLSRLNPFAKKQEEEEQQQQRAPGRPATPPAPRGGSPGQSQQQEQGSGILGGIASRLPFGGDRERSESPSRSTARPGAPPSGARAPGAPSSGRPGRQPPASGAPGQPRSGVFGGQRRPGGTSPSRPGASSGAPPRSGPGGQPRPGGASPGRPGSQPRPGAPGSGSPSRPSFGSQPRTGGLPGSQPRQGTPGGGSPPRPGSGFGSQPRPGGTSPGRPGSPPGSQPRSGAPPSQPGGFGAQPRPGGASPGRPGGLPGSSPRPSGPGGAPSARPGGASPSSRGATQVPSRPAGAPGAPSRAPAQPPTGRPPSRTPATTAARKRKAKAKPTAEEPLVSLDTKLDILGIGMVVVALVTILSFFSKEPGSLTGVWLLVIRQLFGWGAWVVPVVIAVLGIWLILRRFEDRFKIEPVRYIGAVATFVGALAMAHVILMLLKPVGLVYVNPALQNDPTRDMWAEAIPCPSNPARLAEQGYVPVYNASLSSFGVARCGHGGGYVGAMVYYGLSELVGQWGVLFFSLSAVLIGAMMTAKLTAKEAIELIGKSYQKTRTSRSAAPAKAQAKEKEEEKPAPKPAVVTTTSKPSPTKARSSPPKPQTSPEPSPLAGKPASSPSGPPTAPSPTARPPGPTSAPSPTTPRSPEPGALQVPPRPGASTVAPGGHPPAPARPTPSPSPPSSEDEEQKAEPEREGRAPLSAAPPPGVQPPSRSGPRAGDRPSPPTPQPPAPRQTSFGGSRPVPKPPSSPSRLEELGEEEVDADAVIQELVADEKPEPKDAEPAAGRLEVPARPAPQQATQAHEEAKPSETESRWQFPNFRTVLEITTDTTISQTELRRRAEIIEQTLASFGAPGRVVEIHHGPVITQFGVEPDYIDGRSGKRIKVKVGKISSLSDDLALALEAPSIRIEAPVPGRGYVGVEVPNPEPSIVGLRDVIDTPVFRDLNSSLKLALGQNVSGHPVVADLTAMPHLLIAGTTGSGKSVCINGIICTMLLTCSPDMLKMIMVDPKRVELTNYNGIPHLMSPVVVELERIVGVLKWVQHEMDGRYRKFAMAGARNITDYNSRVAKGRVDDELLPYILVIVDELADLMMLAPDETERLVTRLAQMARATGIHIIISTQRPSVDVVTGLIKANFPSRIAFAVATSVDSRVILDMPGAEKLLGRGDMLFQAPDAPLPLRVQGVFVSDQEIQHIVDYWRDQASKHPEWTKEPPQRVGVDRRPSSTSERISAPEGDGGGSEGDDLYNEAVELVRTMGKASISLLQRHLRIGYTRAARLIDLMEEQGIVSEHEGGSKPRLVLDSTDDEDEEADAQTEKDED